MRVMVLAPWGRFLAHLPVPSRPHQYEFARLQVTNTIMSKRKLLKLVNSRKGMTTVLLTISLVSLDSVRGWDDPRMPTISGMRRRGVTPKALRTFCQKVGVSTSLSTIDSVLLDECIREDLEVSSLWTYSV